jgi:tRNA-Thr(GGU) m(6)t(6)A37 methyltransferase TsaA
VNSTPEESDAITLEPIGHVACARSELVDDNWGDVTAVIKLDPERYGKAALFGLEDFSHLEVVFHFHRVPLDKIQIGARHPRNNNEWPLVGIFAQRGKNRPNRLGVSRCELIEVKETEIHVRGLDAVDGTPVLDIKPYMSEFAPRGTTKQPQWSVELMGEYY